MDETGTAWGDWFRNLTGSVVNLAAQKEYVLDPQAEAAKWQALGQLGYYREGLPGTTTQQAQGLNGTVLLLGLGLVAILMLKD